MPKYITVLHEELQPHRRARFPWIVLLLVVLAASPLLYEGGLIVVGKWQALFGTFTEVKTPLLDWLANAWEATRNAYRYQAPAFLRFKGLPPHMVVGAIAAFALFGALFLRRD